jgi:hypothetical protein
MPPARPSASPIAGIDIPVPPQPTPATSNPASLEPYAKAALKTAQSEQQEQTKIEEQMKEAMQQSAPTPPVASKPDIAQTSPGQQHSGEISLNKHGAADTAPKGHEHTVRIDREHS